MTYSALATDKLTRVNSKSRLCRTVGRHNKNNEPRSLQGLSGGAQGVLRGAQFKLRVKRPSLTL